MTKRTHTEYSHRRELNAAGIDVRQTDSIEFNSGSETLAHGIAKLLAAWYLKEQGWRVSSEVECPGGEMDIVAYGRDEPAICVEVKTSPTDEVIQDKLERYVYSTPIRDMFVINPNEMPTDWNGAYKYVGELL